MSAAAYIAVDWGSSGFRAFLISDNGNILAEKTTAEGVLKIQNGGFETVLRSNCGEWLKKYPEMPFITGGMIGSRNGWQEVPYIPCPVSADDIRAQFTRVQDTDDLTILIGPGVSGENAYGAPDVMRGEEIQIFGALALKSVEDTLLCLPGTHSKWCRVENGTITSLSTYLTGELYALLSEQSSLAGLVNDQIRCEESFLSGIEASRQPSGLLNNLFSIRASAMISEASHTSPASFLSGLVIGTELCAICDQTDVSAPVILVGNAILNQRYEAALNAFGIQAICVNSNDAFLAGIKTLQPPQA